MPENFTKTSFHSFPVYTQIMDSHKDAQKKKQNSKHRIIFAPFSEKYVNKSTVSHLSRNSEMTHDTIHLWSDIRKFFISWRPEIISLIPRQYLGVRV